MNHPQFAILQCFFSASPLPQHQELSSGLQSFVPGEPIVREGKLATHLHLICRGRVQVVKQRPDGQPSRTTILSKGSSLGLPAVLANSSYTATALALTPVQTYPVAQPVLREFLETHPQYYQYLAQQLARTLLQYEKIMG